MDSRELQNVFLKGEISPTLAARTDTKLFYQGLSIATNLMLKPHGGVRRRPGTEQISTMVYTEEVRLEPFEFSDDQSYLVVFKLDEIDVFKDDVLINTIDLNTFLTRDMTADERTKMDVIQSADTMVVTHGTFYPFRIVRNQTSGLFEISNLPLTNIPIFDYTTNTAGQIEEFKGDGTTTDFLLIYTNPFFSVYVDDVKTILYTYDSAVGDISFTVAPASGAIIQVISGSAMTANNQDIPYEPVWSVTRGYPETATFHQNRLFFGGSTSKPTSVWGSVTNDQFNFALGDGAGDYGIFDTIQSNSYNGISNIVSGRALQVYTETAEFSNSAKIITPVDSAWARQSAYGSRRVRPVILDGTTFFVDKSKRTIRQFIYNFDEDGYVSPSITLLSDQLFTDIKDMGVVSGTGDDISSILYAIDANGNINVLNTMRSEDISGWTHFETDGLFKGVSVVGETIYTVVLRDSQYFIEKFTEDSNMDFTSSATSATRIEILDDLTGTEFDVIADGSYMGKKAPYLDTGKWYVDIGRTATFAQAGLGFTVELETLPLNTITKAGDTINRHKRVSKVVLNLYQSLGVTIQSEALGDRVFPIVLDEAPQPFTGIKEIYLLGWDRLLTITVTQALPLPFTLLSLESEMTSS